MVTKYTDAGLAVANLPLADHPHAHALAGHDHLSDTGWQPLPFLNGWDDYVTVFVAPDPWELGRFRVTNGMCWLDGLIGHPNPEIPDTWLAFAQLPDWARPGRQQLTLGAGRRSGTSHAQRIDIYPNGYCYAQHTGSLGKPAWVSLSGIRFVVGR